MFHINGYKLAEELYISRNSTVLRARRQSNGMPVVLKRLNEPTPERLAWFRREYDLTQSLADVPGSINVYGIEQHPAGWVLVLEDIGGDSLARLRLAGALDLRTVLRLAADLTRTLGEIHQRRIIHKDINPANIVYHPQSQQVKLIDFGLSTKLAREITTFRSATVLEGTLHYLAPEQTGRMNARWTIAATFMPSVSRCMSC
ncbi:MAG: protein kinase [Chloroflexaceae bacterium]|nr:protein kinase [Chloroflexaceae bacterium]